MTFHGQLDDDTVTEMFEGCLALCFPGTEDFGIAPVEANAAGKPVVAFAAGGALETLEGGVTAVLFRERTVPAVIEAMRRVADLPTPEEQLAAAARRFSPQAFGCGLTEAMTRCARAPARPDRRRRHRDTRLRRPSGRLAGAGDVSRIGV